MIFLNWFHLNLPETVTWFLLGAGVTPPVHTDTWSLPPQWLFDLSLLLVQSKGQVFRVKYMSINYIEQQKCYSVGFISHPKL